MNLEIILFISIVLFAGISIVLGIINLMRLSSTSLKIINLEEAIEKKSKQFDLLKKERQTLSSQEPLRKRDFYNEIPEPALTPDPGHPPIEVVRNLPTGFKTVDVEGIKAKAAYTTVERNDTSERQNPLSNNTIELVLFSEIKHDTDFVSAWKKLSDHLSTSSMPHVVINFKNVMFLYEKELLYLEKIQDVVIRAHGTILFTNYHHELRSALSTRPSLAHLIAR